MTLNKQLSEDINTDQVTGYTSMFSAKHVIRTYSYEG